VGLLVTPLLEGKGALSGIFDLVSCLLSLTLLHELERLYDRGLRRTYSKGAMVDLGWSSAVSQRLSVFPQLAAIRTAFRRVSSTPTRGSAATPFTAKQTNRSLVVPASTGTVLTCFLSMTNQVILRPFAMRVSAWCPSTMSHQDCSCCSLLLNHEPVLRLHNIHP
jgi:hypothetical protein